MNDFKNKNNNSKTVKQGKGKTRAGKSYGKKDYRNDMLNNARSNGNYAGCRSYQTLDNDVVWYGSETAIKERCSWDNYFVLGAPKHVNSAIGTLVPDEEVLNVTGMCKFNWVPTMSDSDGSFSSPINYVSRVLFNQMRKGKSGVATFQPSDIIKYIGGSMGLIEFHAWMLRLYAAHFTTEPENNYLCDSLVQAMDGAPSLKENLGDFLIYINEYATQVNAIPIPDKFPIFKRRYWMRTALYADRSTSKAQLYFYDSRWFQTLDPLSTPTKLKAIQIDPSGSEQGMTLQKIRAFGQQLLDNFMSTPQYEMLTSEMLNTFGSSLYVLPAIEPGVRLAFNTSDEVLHQFQNITAVCQPTVTSEDGSLTLLEDVKVGEVYVGRVKSAMSEPYSYGGLAEVVASGNVLINTVGTPTPQSNMVGTRMTVAFKSDGNITSYGTEIPSIIQLYTIVPTSGGSDPAQDTTILNVQGGYTVFNVEDDAAWSWVSKASMFKAFPLLHPYSKIQDGAKITAKKHGIIGDVDFIAVRTISNLASAHYQAIKGLFGVSDTADALADKFSS